MAQPRSRIRLTRKDWIDAALQALADDGPSGVAVERLAARQGTTKGSFYWHFKDREELVTEALVTWEREETDALIEEMKEISDPVERLRTGMVMATEYEEEERPDVRLLPSASDPVVGEVVKRVQRKRLDFLAETFRDADFTPAESRLRARLAYSLFLGWHHQRLSEGSERATPRERAAYQRRAVELLMNRALDAGSS
ncbi:MAG: TetR/AcrR family transcriptional regulator [Actinomycetota bacterium]|nr:TetR/AcrR family transcriptional regulator [Actinomycetota bacterium]